MFIRVLKDNYSEKLISLRKEAYDLDGLSNDYVTLLKMKKIIVFGAFINNNLIGSSYVSNCYHSLYIEQLFIKPEYQRKGLGSLTLLSILKEKEMVEEYYSQKFTISRLVPMNSEVSYFYRKLGYQDSYYYPGILEKKL